MTCLPESFFRTLVVGHNSLLHVRYMYVLSIRQHTVIVIIIIGWLLNKELQVPFINWVARILASTSVLLWIAPPSVGMVCKGNKNNKFTINAFNYYYPVVRTGSSNTHFYPADRTGLVIPVFFFRGGVVTCPRLPLGQNNTCR